MSTLAWQHVEDYMGLGVAVWRAVVQTRGGDWEILLQPRPSYCDRGRWLADVFDDDTKLRVLDEQEGFPRYYFALERAKAELEEWVSRRSEILAEA